MGLQHHSMAPNVNFSGTWLCVDVTGDPDGVLSEMDVSYMMRTMASTMGYGKGKAVLKIQHEGSNYQIEKVVQKQTDKLVIGGGTQVVDTKEGKKECTLEWYGDALVQTMLTKGIVVRTTMEGDKLVTTMKTPTGKEMRRVHDRQ